MGKRISDMTPEELREAGRKGAMASKEAKRKKKYMKEVLEMHMGMKICNQHRHQED